MVQICVEFDPASTRWHRKEQGLGIYKSQAKSSQPRGTIQPVRVGGQIDFKWIAFTVCKAPMVDEGRTLTIGSKFALKFEPSLRQLDREVMVGPEYHQPGSPVAEWDLMQVDAVLEQVEIWRIKVHKSSF